MLQLFFPVTFFWDLRKTAVPNLCSTTLGMVNSLRWNDNTVFELLFLAQYVFSVD